jgi:hypothetical protein
MFARTDFVAALVGGLAGADAAILVACLALAAATLIFIFYIEPDAADSAPHRSHLDQLLERRDAIYENLRDLKFEHRAGKFSERDYEETKAALEAEAAFVLAEIETATGGAARLPRQKAPRMSAPVPGTGKSAS